MADSFYTERLEELVKELLALDEQRMAVVWECAEDLTRGVELTRPIMARHKLVLLELRQLVGED